MTQTAAALTLVDRQISVAMHATMMGPTRRRMRSMTSNENKMSDGGRERASLGVKRLKSSEM
jgi:hypothetical protein